MSTDNKKHVSKEHPEKKSHETASGRGEKGDDLMAQISEAAYGMYVRSGFVHGNDKRDWFEAEKMIDSETKKQKTQ